MLLSGVDTRHRFVGINESVMYHIAPRFSSSGVHRTDSQRARQSSALERPRATERRYDDYRGPEASDLSYTFRICSFVLSREAFDCIFHLGVLVFFFDFLLRLFLLLHVFIPLSVLWVCVCVCRTLLVSFRARAGEDARLQARSAWTTPEAFTVLIVRYVGMGEREGKKRWGGGLAAKEWTPICMYVG